MEALGQLTGGIAHDFNNLLMIVSGYAQILQRRLSEPKDKQAVEAIRAAANRGEKLTRQLLAFSRRQQLMPVVVDLRQRIDAVRDMLVPSLRGNIELICDIEDKIWPVEVDLGELELALVNIAVNARDAMPDGGTITLSARNVVLKPGSAAGALEGDFVAFMALLLLTSLSGLALLAWRDSAAMALLLALHLGVVMALFATLPYGKFAHGVYRSAALLKWAIEKRLPNRLRLGAD